MVSQNVGRAALVPPPAATLPANNRIAENVISNCGYNGIAIVSGIGNLVENNTLTDCNLDIEPESEPAEPVVGNVLRGNKVIQLTRPGPLDPNRGDRRRVFFSSCAVRACDMTGGATVVATNNTFVNDVLVFPYCRQGAVSQVWLNNSSTNGGIPHAPDCDLSTGSRMKASPAALSIITSEVLAR
jgi:parallel beta-helix repeat protein